MGIKWWLIFLSEIQTIIQISNFGVHKTCTIKNWQNWNSSLHLRSFIWRHIQQRLLQIFILTQNSKGLEQIHRINHQHRRPYHLQEPYRKLPINSSNCAHQILVRLSPLGVLNCITKKKAIHCQSWWSDIII